MGKKILFLAITWIGAATAILLLYLLREVSTVKDFIAWAFSVWQLLTVIFLVAIAISGWIIKHNFGKKTTIESIQILKTDNERFGLEILIDNTNSRKDTWIKEILLGGRAARPQVGRTPFLTRVIFQVTMDCVLREGVGVITGQAAIDEGDSAYHLQGTYKHIDGTPKMSWDFSLSFKPTLKLPAGDKLPIVLIFKPATKKVEKLHQEGKNQGCYIAKVTEKRLWVEVVTNIGVIKYEMEDASFLEFLANYGVEVHKDRSILLDGTTDSSYKGDK